MTRNPVKILSNSQGLTLHSVRTAERNNTLPVVFIHGWGGDSAVWAPLLRLLNYSGSISTLDLPGFGRNSHSKVDSLEELQNLIAEALPAKCLLVGWSLGGMIATQLALGFPKRIVGLVTIAANLKFVAQSNWQEGMSNADFVAFSEGFSANPTITLRRFTQLQVKGDANSKQVLSWLRDKLNQLDDMPIPKWARMLAFLSEIDNRDGVKEIESPALHIFGDNDAIVPVAVAKNIRDAVILDGVAHAPHLSCPQKVAGLIHQFVDSHHELSRYHKQKSVIAKSFSRAANSYDSLAILQRKVADHLLSLQQYPYIGVLADFGSGTGYCSQYVGAVAETHEMVNVDIAIGMLSYAKQQYEFAGGTSSRQKLSHIAGDIEHLPFAGATFDGGVSSLSVQWCEDVSRVFEEIYRVLKPGAWCLLSTLEPGTLFELEQAWSQIDSYIHVNQFVAQTVFDEAIAHAGLRIERYQSQKEIMHYPDLSSLMRALKGIGAHNVNSGKNNALTGAGKIRALFEAYEQYRNSDGLPATYKVGYYLLVKPS